MLQQLLDKGKAADSFTLSRAPSPTGPSQVLLLPQAQAQHQAPLLLQPSLIRLADLSSIPGHVTDASFPRVGEPLQAPGGDGHGPIGHGRTTTHRGMSLREHTPRAPPVMGTHNSQFPPGESSCFGDRNYHRFHHHLDLIFRCSTGMVPELGV